MDWKLNYRKLWKPSQNHIDQWVARRGGSLLCFDMFVVIASKIEHNGNENLLKMFPLIKLGICAMFSFTLSWYVVEPQYADRTDLWFVQISQKKTHKKQLMVLLNALTGTCLLVDLLSYLLPELCMSAAPPKLLWALWFCQFRWMFMAPFAAVLFSFDFFFFFGSTGWTELQELLKVVLEPNPALRFSSNFLLDLSVVFLCLRDAKGFTDVL